MLLWSRRTRRSNKPAVAIHSISSITLMNADQEWKWYFQDLKQNWSRCLYFLKLCSIIFCLLWDFKTTHTWSDPKTVIHHSNLNNNQPGGKTQVELEGNSLTPAPGGNLYSTNMIGAGCLYVCVCCRYVYFRIITPGGSKWLLFQKRIPVIQFLKCGPWTVTINSFNQ